MLHLEKTARQQTPIYHELQKRTIRKIYLLDWCAVEILVSTKEWAIILAYKMYKVKCYPRNRPWRPVGLSDVKDPTLSRESAHR
jgi:hypothetical protein